MGTIKKLLRSLEERYRRLFSIQEIENESILQWAFGGSLFFFFVTFNRWISSPNVTIEQAERGSAVCWEYFQNCTQFFFLHEIGTGYSQTIFYMVLYGLMLLIVYCMWRKKWVHAHMLLVLLLLWEILVTLVLSFSDGAPYYYYHIVLTTMLLFVPHKEFFLKLSFVFMYFMSVTTKLDSTWILGTYFTALRDGLPLFPDSLAAPITNFVIFMQMVGSWFLLSRNKILQRLSFIYCLAFHLYSGVFVLYFYPSVSLPPLLILFGPMYRYTPIPFSKKAIAGWMVLVLIAIFQLLGFTAPGDRRMTLEGNKFGMFMFEANHQCVVTVSTYFTDAPSVRPDYEVAAGTRCSGFFCLVKTTTSKVPENLTLREERYESGTAWNRCYPYEWWSRYHLRCRQNSSIDHISLTLDHSINGGPFYRTVDLSNICELPYYPFGGNSWIRQPPEAPLMGYPVTNTYN